MSAIIAARSFCAVSPASMQVCDRLALLASMLVNFNHRLSASSGGSSHHDQWFDV
jgi:hypothetical protein